MCLVLKSVCSGECSILLLLKTFLQIIAYFSSIVKFPFTVAGHAIDNAVCFQNISPGLFYLCLQDAQRDFLKKYQVTL